MVTKRYKSNPFLSDMLVPVKDKHVKISTLGEDENVIINQATGEIKGTHLTTYKKVDTQNFVKIFSQNIGLTFGLTAAGIKAFNVLIDTVQKDARNSDEVMLDSVTLQRFLNAQNQPLRLSIATFRRGIAELEKSKIIAKTMRAGEYYLNPNFAFNGDRIAFTTLIERDEGMSPTLVKGQRHKKDRKTTAQFDLEDYTGKPKQPYEE